MATAAFLTRDSYLGEISRPLTLNRYGYCLGNPVYYVDPSGHWIYEEELIKIYGEYGKMSAKAAQDALLRKDVNLPSFTQMTRFLSALHEVGSPNATVGYVTQYDYTKGGQYVHEVEQMAEQRNQGYACDTRKEWVTLEMMNSDPEYTWKFKEIESYDLATSLPVYKEERPITQSDVDEINRVLNKYDINTPNRVAHFLAQCDTESENGAKPLELYNGDNIFEYFKKYEDANNSFGNIEKGDGAKYRGGGAIQMTGRNAYTGFSVYMGDEQILSDGALYVAQNYYWESAAYYWSIYKPNSANDDRFDTNKKCDEGKSVKVITGIVKGKTDGWEYRVPAYKYYLMKLSLG